MLLQVKRRFASVIPEGAVGHDEGWDAIVDALIENPAADVTLLVTIGKNHALNALKAPANVRGGNPVERFVRPECPSFGEFLEGLSPADRDTLTDALHISGIQADAPNDALRGHVGGTKRTEYARTAQRRALRAFRKSPVYRKALEYVA